MDLCCGSLTLLVCALVTIYLFLSAIDRALVPWKKARVTVEHIQYEPAHTMPNPASDGLADISVDASWDVTVLLDGKPHVFNTQVKPRFAVGEPIVVEYYVGRLSGDIKGLRHISGVHPLV